MFRVTGAEPESPIVNRKVMGSKLAARVVPLLCAVLLLGAGALLFWPRRGVNIYGRLSPSDIAEIRMVQRTDCARRIGPGWYQRFCPTSIRRLVAGGLSPVDGIYVQENGSVILVYRSAFQPAYGSDGKRLWGLTTRTLRKSTNGWAFSVPYPNF
jgi:hypothetical protein